MNRFLCSLGLFSKTIFWSRSNTELAYHGTPKVHDRRFIKFIMCENPAWIETRWNSIRLRARSHTTSPYTWGTTLHDFGSVLGRPLDTSFGLSQFHNRSSWLTTIPNPNCCFTYMDVVYFLSRVLPLLPTTFTRQNSCCISKTTMKHMQQTHLKNRTSPSLVMAIGSAYSLISWLQT
jgi:hypothetical protein